MQKNEIAKIEEPKIEEKPKMRQIVIETNGSDVHLVKAEIAGTLELESIFLAILSTLKKR
jgi:hypothetical protein